MGRGGVIWLQATQDDTRYVLQDEREDTANGEIYKSTETTIVQDKEGSRLDKRFADGEMDMIALAESESDWEARVNAHRGT